MFLKNLDIYGFKSFADRTRVEFADGITALLGPNGCGKSNVVDAIKWVLGEQASRAMRAEKMEDVIFNGTENRKPLNVAEVTLTLANDAGLLPIDMPEIEIKRRLYRSGESEYFINAAAVRLKEVRELFWDTGVGKAAYSVMEQGKIDQILSSKPDERRYLFEEAAGITKFKVRGVETERKLQKTEENMRQVEVILAEIKRSYDILKTQADKTLKYRAFREEVFNYELDIQLLRLKQFRNDKNERGEEFKRRTADRDRLREEMEAMNKALEENMDLVNSLEGKFAEFQKQVLILAGEKVAREKEGKLLSEQKAEVKAKISQNEDRERATGLKIEELIEDAEEQDGVVRDLRKKVQDIFLAGLYEPFAELFSVDRMQELALILQTKAGRAEKGEVFIKELWEPALKFITAAAHYLDGGKGAYDAFKTDLPHKSLRSDEIWEHLAAWLRRIFALAAYADVPPEDSGKAVKTIFKELKEEFAEGPGLAAFSAGYGVLSILRSVIGAGASGSEAAALMNHWGLDRKLRECWAALGIDSGKAWQLSGLMGAILRRTNPPIIPSKIPSKEPSKEPPTAETLIVENYDAEDFRKVLGVNLYDGVIWFNKECFEGALHYAPLFLMLDSTAESETDWLGYINLVAAIAEQFRAAEGLSAYRLDGLLAALGDDKPAKKPAAKASTTAKTKGRKK
ncbi:hypothetical protein FACS189461_3990 [Spirochaetia bacterium]|nr:hypothetical protein FACS189461_3990 [Spirochaetia bacterium]